MDEDKEIARAERLELYKSVTRAVDFAWTGIVPNAEKAAILRQIADQTEKADTREGQVGRSQDRIAERNARQRGPGPWNFFQKGRTDAADERKALPPKDWSAENAAKAAAVQPMKPYRKPDHTRER